MNRNTLIFITLLGGCVAQSPGKEPDTGSISETGHPTDDLVTVTGHAPEDTDADADTDADSDSDTDADSDSDTDADTDADSDADSDSDTDADTDTDADAFDNDGDGFSEEDGDCDDDFRSVNPGASEFCDERDNDCDGLTDEGDACSDGDTGSAESDTGAAPEDSGSVDSGGTGDTGAAPEDSGSVDADGDGFSPDGDCDDANASVNPGAVEACDGLDNDCDGNVDEGDACSDPSGDTGSADTDTGAAPEDSGSVDSGGTGDTGAAPEDSGTGVDTGGVDTNTDDTATSTEEPPCTECVVVTVTPSVTRSSATVGYEVDADAVCADLGDAWDSATATADGSTWSFQVENAADSDVVRYSLEYSSSQWSCMGSSLDGTHSSTYYEADGTSCSVTVTELLKSSGGCEAQFIASCSAPATPTCSL